MPEQERAHVAPATLRGFVHDAVPVRVDRAETHAEARDVRGGGREVCLVGVGVGVRLSIRDGVIFLAVATERFCKNVFFALVAVLLRALRAPHRGVAPERVHRRERALTLLHQPTGHLESTAPHRPVKRRRAFVGAAVHVDVFVYDQVSNDVQVAVPRRPVQRRSAPVRPAPGLMRRGVVRVQR